VIGLVVFAAAGALVAAAIAETISVAVRSIYRLLTRESAR